MICPLVAFCPYGKITTFMYAWAIDIIFCSAMLSFFRTSGIFTTCKLFSKHRGGLFVLFQAFDAPVTKQTCSILW